MELNGENKEPGVTKPMKDETRLAEEKFNHESAFFYLMYLNDPFSILNDQKAMADLKQIYFNSIFSTNRLEMMKSSFDYDFCRVICVLVEHAYKMLDNYLNLALNYTGNDQMFETCAICVGIIRNFSNYFRKFGEIAHEAGFIKTALQFIRNDKLVDAFTVHSDIKARRIVRPLIGALVNLSKLYPSFREKWTDENSFEGVFELSEKLKPEDKLATYLVLANIADFKETNKPEGIDQVISVIVQKTQEISKAIENGENLVRLKVRTNIEEFQIVARLSSDSAIWHLIEFIDSLYRISCNIPIKLDTYRQMGLKSIIFNGNATEVEYALKLLYQLCFNEEILEDVRKDQDLVNKIKDLANCYLDELIKSIKVTDSLIKLSNGIMWLLSMRPPSPSQAQFAKQDDIRFIMLSYERESYDMCAKLKEAFEKENIKVWMDSGDLHESSLELMGRVLENATCVIVCMSERYKMNPFCRTEAHYALLSRKPVLTTVFQEREKYLPNGWLEKYFGSKTPIDFSESAVFTLSFDQLLSEIRKSSPGERRLSAFSKPQTSEKKQQKIDIPPESINQNINEISPSLSTPTTPLTPLTPQTIETPKTTNQSVPYFKEENVAKIDVIPRYSRPLFKENTSEKSDQPPIYPELKTEKIKGVLKEPKVDTNAPKDNGKEVRFKHISSPSSESSESEMEHINGWVHRVHRIGEKKKKQLLFSPEPESPKELDHLLLEPRVHKFIEKGNIAQEKEEEIEKTLEVKELKSEKIDSPNGSNEKKIFRISISPESNHGSKENIDNTFRVLDKQISEEKIFINSSEKKPKTEKRDKSAQRKEEQSLKKVTKETKSEWTETTPELDINVNGLKSFNQPYDWTQKDVEKWLKDKHISPVIARNLLPCDGQILNQLYLMQSQAPDYFYKMINTNTNIPIREIAVFTLELKKIFQDN